MSKGKKPWRKDLDLLSDKQIAKYEDSLDVLGLVRKGKSLNQASKKVGISPTTVKKYVGSALKLKNKRIVAKKRDSLLRKIRINENGKEAFIQTRGRKNSSISGKYLSAVGQSIDNNDTSALKPFEGKTIIDHKGKHHVLETNLDKLRQISERREEREFFSIYHRR